MKKIKLLSAIATIAVASPALLVLTQCNKSHGEPVIDPSVSDKITMTTETDSENNVICKIATKSNKNKISSVEVYIGSTKLTSGTDYKTDATNADALKITIFKKALDSHKGTISVKPVVLAKEFTGLIVEHDTMYVGDTMKTNNIHIYQSLEGIKGDGINWTQAVTIYEGSQLLEDFATTGYTFTEEGTKIFTIKYTTSSPVKTFSAPLNVTVEKRTHTVSCSVVGDALKLDKTSISVKDGTTWSAAVKPEIIAQTDVDKTCLKTDWTKDGTTPIDPTETVTGPFSAKLTYDFNSDPEMQDPTVCDTSKTYGKYNCYSTASAINVISANEYVFTVDLKAVTAGKKFTYFWIVTPSGSRMMNVYIKNITSITYGDDNVEFEVTSDSYGRYITFKQTFTAGTDGKVLKVNFRPMIGKTGSEFPMYPVFEAD